MHRRTPWNCHGTIGEVVAQPIAHMQKVRHERNAHRKLGFADYLGISAGYFGHNDSF
jgi:hypothetical protein